MIRRIAFLLALASVPAQVQAKNVLLFVTDGLRASAVNEADAPTMSEIRAKGVNFANSFSVFPTFTMVNASAFATGHHPGDTGIFANTILVPNPIITDARRKSITPFLEYDPALREVNALYGGSVVNGETLIAAAQRSGYSTAAIGKHGPTALQDIADFDRQKTIVIDDATGVPFPGNDGRMQGVVLAPDVEAAILQATGIARSPARRANGEQGNCDTPGTKVANVAQEDWFTKVATDVVLPRFKAADKPFFLVFWSRDPDGTQHNHGDSHGQLTPGINGPTVRAALTNADNVLRRLRESLDKLGLAETTDIVVVADHGFSTIAKESQTSGSATLQCAGMDRALPQGFLALDIAREFGMTLYDPTADMAPIKIPGGFPRRGDAVLGTDPAKPEMVVTANGGSDLVFLPSPARKKLAPKIVKFLLTQDYVSGVFVDDALGNIPGTLPLSAIGLIGGANTTRPAIIVNFRSFSTGCENPLLCAAEIADTPAVQGQGMHGSFSRADTNNFMTAIGPSFKAGYVNRAPSSNADIAMTIASILDIKPRSGGKLAGRVLTEAMPGGKDVTFTRTTVAGKPADGLATTILVQQVGKLRYLEAGGFPGRTLGLEGQR